MSILLIYLNSGNQNGKKWSLLNWSLKMSFVLMRKNVFIEIAV